MENKKIAVKETVLIKIYDLLLYIIPLLAKFPRDQKFLLADRIENRILDTQEELIVAYYSEASKKPAILRRVNLDLEKLRYLIRLSHDLKFFSNKQYGLISDQINEIGRMVGGWYKSLVKT